MYPNGYPSIRLDIVSGRDDDEFADAHRVVLKQVLVVHVVWKRWTCRDRFGKVMLFGQGRENSSSRISAKLSGRNRY